MVRDDRIRGYGQLLDWASERGVLPEAALDQLREEAAADPDARRRALGRAWAFRRALHDCLRAIIRREQPPEASVGLINAAIADAPPPFLLLTTGADGVAFTMPAGPHPDPLLPILRSALILLSSPDLARMRECAAERCGRLYLDHTKNHSRRWCDMGTCGNRAKARRHQARQRQPLP